METRRSTAPPPPQENQGGGEAKHDGLSETVAGIFCSVFKRKLFISISTSNFLRRLDKRKRHCLFQASSLQCMSKQKIETNPKRYFKLCAVAKKETRIKLRTDTLQLCNNRSRSKIRNRQFSPPFSFDRDRVDSVLSARRGAAAAAAAAAAAPLLECAYLS